MPRRRARAEPDSPERLAAAVAWHRSAVARLNALRSGRPLPPAAPPLPYMLAPDPASASPQQIYRATARLLGETTDDL